MKIAVHACLESMLFEALNEVKKAHKESADAYIAFMESKTNDTSMRYAEAASAVEKADKRYCDLLTTKRIIKEMEEKGVEL